MPSPDLLVVIAVGLRGVGAFSAMARGAKAAREATIAGSVLLLLLYALLDAAAYAAGERAGRLVYRGKAAIVAALIGLLFLQPAVQWMRERPRRIIHVHDGMIETEEAMRFLLQGKNPYAETYEKTPMAQWPYTEGSEPALNPALFHLAYAPLTFLLPIPFYGATRLVTAACGLPPWWDGRVPLILAWITLTIAGARLGRTPPDRLMLAVLLGLNPFLARHTVWGQNEGLALLWIVLVAGALLAGRERRAGVFLGLACATKATAWPLALFYLARLFGRAAGERRERLLASARQAIPFAATFALIMGPFFLWSPARFIEDLLSFPAGGGEPNYPIKGAGGFGFGTFVLLFGWARPHDAFPFILFQLAFGIPALFLLLRLQQRHNTIAMMLAAFAVWEMVWLYFARFLHNNYLGLLFAVLVLAFFVSRAESRSIGEKAEYEGTRPQGDEESGEAASCL